MKYYCLMAHMISDGVGDAMHLINVVKKMKEVPGINHGYKLLIILRVDEDASNSQKEMVLSKFHTSGIISSYDPKSDTFERINENNPNIYIFSSKDNMFEKYPGLVGKLSQTHAVCEMSSGYLSEDLKSEGLSIPGLAEWVQHAPFFAICEFSDYDYPGDLTTYTLGVGMDKSKKSDGDDPAAGILMNYHAKQLTQADKAACLKDLSDGTVVKFFKRIDSQFGTEGFNYEHFLETNLVIPCYFQKESAVRFFKMYLELVAKSELIKEFQYRRIIFSVPKNTFDYSSVNEAWLKEHGIDSLQVHSCNEGELGEIDTSLLSDHKSTERLDSIGKPIGIEILEGHFFSDRDFELIQKIAQHFTGVSGDNTIQQALEAGNIPLLQLIIEKDKVYKLISKLINGDPELQAKYQKLSEFCALIGSGKLRDYDIEGHKKYLESLEGRYSEIPMERWPIPARRNYPKIQKKLREAIQYRPTFLKRLSQLMSSELSAQWKEFSEFIFKNHNAFDKIELLFDQKLLDSAKMGNDIDEIARLEKSIAIKCRKDHTHVLEEKSSDVILSIESLPRAIKKRKGPDFFTPAPQDNQQVDSTEVAISSNDMPFRLKINPNQPLIEQIAAIHETVTSLDLSRNGLGKLIGADLVKVLGAIPEPVTSLNLSGNHLDNRSGAELAQAFKAISENVHTVNLSKNNFRGMLIDKLELLEDALPFAFSVFFSEDDVENMSKGQLFCLARMMPKAINVKVVDSDGNSVNSKKVKYLQSIAGRVSAFEIDNDEKHAGAIGLEVSSLFTSAPRDKNNPSINAPEESTSNTKKSGCTIL